MRFEWIISAQELVTCSSNHCISSLSLSPSLSASSYPLHLYPPVFSGPTSSSTHSLFLYSLRPSLFLLSPPLSKLSGRAVEYNNPIFTALETGVCSNEMMEKE